MANESALSDWMEFEVNVHGDANVELDEEFVVILSNPIWASLGDSLGVGTITSDDIVIAISIDDVALLENLGGDITKLYSEGLY